eukprot:745967-Pelagomonas_calceolata.AAC.1
MQGEDHGLRVPAAVPAGRGQALHMGGARPFRVVYLQKKEMNKGRKKRAGQLCECATVSKPGPDAHVDTHTHE